MSHLCQLLRAGGQACQVNLFILALAGISRVVVVGGGGVKKVLEERPWDPRSGHWAWVST